MGLPPACFVKKFENISYNNNKCQNNIFLKVKWSSFSVQSSLKLKPDEANALFHILTELFRVAAVQPPADRGDPVEDGLQPHVVLLEWVKLNFFMVREPKKLDRFKDKESCFQFKYGLKLCNCLHKSNYLVLIKSRKNP